MEIKNKCFVFVEVRTEAVMQALAQHNKRVPVMPLPSKRTSVNYKGQERQRDRHGKIQFLVHLIQRPMLAIFITCPIRIKYLLDTMF